MQALALLEGGQDITLLFTDIVTPEMSGRELADRLLKLRPIVPMIVTMGYTKNAVVPHGILDLGTNFLPKPFSIDELAAKVAEVLGKKAG